MNWNWAPFLFTRFSRYLTLAPLSVPLQYVPVYVYEAVPASCQLLQGSWNRLMLSTSFSSTTVFEPLFSIIRILLCAVTLIAVSIAIRNKSKLLVFMIFVVFFKSIHFLRIYACLM